MKKKFLQSFLDLAFKAFVILAVLGTLSMVMQTRSQLKTADNEIQELTAVIDYLTTEDAETGEVQIEGASVAGVTTSVEDAVTVEEVSKYLVEAYADELQGEQGEKGEQGEPGQPGASGANQTIMTYYSSASGSRDVTAKAACQDGLKPIGGGCRGNNTAVNRVVITQSYPSGVYWNCAATHMDGHSFELNAAVICSN